MRVRPPSIGFLYFALAIAGVAWFFIYLIRPMWWELPRGRERDLHEAAYLERIATSGPEEKRAAWLTAAMRLALRHGEWGVCAKLMDRAQLLQVDLPAGVVREIEPGLCWATRLDADRWTRGNGLAVILLRNAGGEAVRYRLVWTSDRSGPMRVRYDRESVQRHDVQTGGETATEHVVPPGESVVFEAGATAAMFEGSDKSGRGVQLVRVEVVR